MADPARRYGYPIDPKRPVEKGHKVIVTFELWGPLNEADIKGINDRFEALIQPNGRRIGVRIGSERVKILSGDGPKGPEEKTTAKAER